MPWTSIIEKSKNLAYRIADLQDCASEPIAFCGAIQSGGLLITVHRETFEIVGASQNWLKDAHGWSAEGLLGMRLEDVIELDGSSAFRPAQLDELCAVDLVSVRNKRSRLPGLQRGHCHRQEEFVHIEFDLNQEVASPYPLAQIKNLVHRLKSVDSVNEACQKTADVVRDLSGFDRVMIYRFDQDWNGKVIGESAKPHLLPFLNLKYPASDIPPQARDLFFKNQVRMIADVRAPAIPILTKNMALQELNIGLTLFRAVSPIHLQYLENMGVRASFAAPIRVNDKLWGLISCHHYSGAKQPEHEVRSAFELAAQIVSSKVGDLVARRRLIAKNQSLELTQSLLNEVARGKDPILSFENSVETLLMMTSSSGVFVRMDGRELMLGQAPARSTLDAILSEVEKQDSLAIWASDRLRDELNLSTVDPDCAGAMAVPFSVGFQDVLIWFRPEELQEISWGGEPRRSAEMTKRELLTPRNSFLEWREKVQGCSRPWTEVDEECAQSLLFGFVQGIFSKAKGLAFSYQSLEQAAKAKDIFIGTISHELRTPLGIIMGWIDILKEYPQADAEATQAIEVIDRNTKLQITLINDLLDISKIISGKLRIEPRPNVDVSEIMGDIVEGLKPVFAAKSLRLHWENRQAVQLTADPDRLRQILWNLVNNAVKFTPKGGDVTIAIEADGTGVRISVSDTGIGIDALQLPKVFETFVQENVSTAQSGGLGLGLSIVKALAELHGGSVGAFSKGRDQGATFVIHFPVYDIVPEERAFDLLPLKVPKSVSRKLAGQRILIVEDQPDALLALKITLERQGATVVTAENGKEALTVLNETSFNLIISDIGMPILNGHDLMITWRGEERKRSLKLTPAIALTAYASSKDRTKALAAGFQSHIPKPMDREELMAVMFSLGIGSLA